MASDAINKECQPITSKSVSTLSTTCIAITARAWYGSRSYCYRVSLQTTCVSLGTLLIFIFSLHGRFVDESEVKPDRDLTGAPNALPNPDTKEIVTEKTANTALYSDASSAEIDEEGKDGDLPNQHQRDTLRRVGDKLPASTWLVAAVELCERFTYYGASGLFQNYVQKPYAGRLGEGALGLGHQGATGLTTFFQFWCYGKLFAIHFCS